MGHPVENRAGTGRAVRAHANAGYLAATLDGFIYIFSTEDPLAPELVFPRGRRTAPSALRTTILGDRLHVIDRLD